VLKYLFAASIAVATLACAGAGDDTDASEGEVVTGKKGPLDAASEDGLYHWSEGSEFLPYFAVRAMKVLERDASGELTGKETDDFILGEVNLARYGFIADKRDASRRLKDKIANDSLPGGGDSLPIGMSLARAPESGVVSLGVNCASCHVGQLEIDGKRQIVPGVANMFEVGRFFGEVIQTLDFLAKQGGPLLKAAYGARLLKEAARAKLVFRDLDDEILGTKDSTVDQVEFVWKLIGARDEFDALVDGMNVSAERKGLLRARKVFFDGLVARIALSKESTLQGFGRTDAFGTAKNMIFFGHGYMKATHAPISFPSMLNMETVDLFHANGNTNSVLQRNIGQAIGLGAIFAEVEGTKGKEVVSSAHLPNLLRLEHAIYKLAPPAWPAKRDAEAAARGEKVYRAECQSCHEPKPLESGLYKSKLVPLTTVGTDPFHLKGLGEHIVPGSGDKAGKDLGHLFSLTGPIFTSIEASYRGRHPGELEKEEQAYIKSSPEAAKIAAARAQPWWRASDGSEDQVYAARPLDGIWATAPFLHNGSVPTLADLLMPAAGRPKAFCVGHRTYDTVKVGYTVVTPKNGKCPAGESLLDTDESNPALAGNSNKGHEFGTRLADGEKRDLIEFLKGFGAGQARPVVLE
jgi:mono/diheme cytochrome c family protein